MHEILMEKVWTPTAADMLMERIFIREEVAELGPEKIADIVTVAVKYRENAYTPYSHYNVGAAVCTTDGQVFGGCNSESVAYSPTNHAEGSALARASNEGLWKKDRRFVKALAVVHDGDSGPCGECLQRIVEFADNCLIIVAKPDGTIRKITSLKALFFDNFNPSHLGK